MMVHADSAAVQNSLREGPSADPPYSMHRALEFQGILVMAVVTFVFLLKGEQTRRAADEQDQARREVDAEAL